MKGVALFIGGPLDEQIRMLPDLFPTYEVPVRDRDGAIALERLRREMLDITGLPESVLPPLVTIRYKRTRICPGNCMLGSTPHAIYEVDL